MKHIRIPLFVWFSIVLLIAAAPVSLSAQESFIQKIEKNNSVSGIKSLDTSRFPEKIESPAVERRLNFHPEQVKIVKDMEQHITYLYRIKNF